MFTTVGSGVNMQRWPNVTIKTWHEYFISNVKLYNSSTRTEILHKTGSHSYFMFVKFNNLYLITNSDV